MPNKRAPNKTSITAYINKDVIYDFNWVCVNNNRCRTDVLATLIKTFLDDIDLQYDTIQHTPKSIFSKRNNNAKQT